MCVSILILTLDEELNLPGCLESVAWADDIVVLDSYSTDRTVEIARAAGARVFQSKLDSWSSRQNWAVQNIDFKHPWIYSHDADERVTPELAREIQTVVSDIGRKEVGYRLRFKNMFMGRWIKGASFYPTWVLRLWRPEKVRWVRSVHPNAIVDGLEGKLQAHFEHYTFNKGITEWFAKNNFYSLLEAKECMAIAKDRINWGGLISRNPTKRRKAFKGLALHIPARSFLVFCYLYFVRLGFLHGRAGFRYCVMRFIYEYMIDIKRKELHRRQKGLPV